jgi:hypothetical protein
MYLDHETLAVGGAAIQPARIRETRRPEIAFLDDVYEMLLAGHVETGMARLGRELYNLYASTTGTEWEQLLQDALLHHPIMDLLMQDPVTDRCYRQPRGYAGDAKLLDMLYTPESVDMSDVTPLGQEISRFITRTSIVETLRNRIRFVGEHVDNICSAKNQPRILSVASGHCREINYSRTLQHGRFSRFVALDSDPKTLDVLKVDYAHLNIEPAPLSVSEIIKGRAFLGQFDLIYSAGLYDYLSKRFAQRLTAALYEMLAPGGTLMLINIAADYPEIGYVESYMNWAMLGRTSEETFALADGLCSDGSATLSINSQSGITSHYHALEIHKR